MPAYRGKDSEFIAQSLEDLHALLLEIYIGPGNSKIIENWGRMIDCDAIRNAETNEKLADMMEDAVLMTREYQDVIRFHALTDGAPSLAQTVLTGLTAWSSFTPNSRADFPLQVGLSVERGTEDEATYQAMRDRKIREINPEFERRQYLVQGLVNLGQASPQAMDDALSLIHNCGVSSEAQDWAADGLTNIPYMWSAAGIPDEVQTQFDRHPEGALAYGAALDVWAGLADLEKALDLRQPMKTWRVPWGLIPPELDDFSQLTGQMKDFFRSAAAQKLVRAGDLSSGIEAGEVLMHDEFDLLNKERFVATIMRHGNSPLTSRTLFASFNATARGAQAIATQLQASVHGPEGETFLPQSSGPVT